MSALDVLLFTPLAFGVAGAWFVAWRVSKTGNGTAQHAARVESIRRGARRTAWRFKL